MTTLVLGATGATGRLLVKQLLDLGLNVKVIVRSPHKLPDTLKNHDKLSVIYDTFLNLSDAEIARHVKGCGAVASCLGHTLSLRGVYRQPRRLVADATRRLCHAFKAVQPERPVRFVLMNTAGNSNRDLDERISLAEKGVVALIRLLVPPHADNEEASDYLRIHVGQDDRSIEWAVVRPDTLIDEDDVTEYEVHSSPTRSAIFNAGKTSRINVGHFMARLITDDEVWDTWRGQMPVIYNKA